MTALQSGQATIEEVVARYPEYAQRLVPLLEVALRVVSTTAPQLSDEAMDAIQGRLLRRTVELQARPRAENRRLAVFSQWMPRFRLLPVTLVLLVALLMSGVWVSSATAASLPGDVLYPLKRMTERVQLGLALSETGRIWLHIRFAERRLEEVQAVLEQRGQLDETTLAEVGDETEAALASAEQLSDDQVEVLTTLATLTERQQAVLAAVKDKAPPQAQAGLTRAMERSRRGHERAQVALQGRHQKPPAPTPHPTHTPQPAYTPKPTHTPKPSHTPQPTRSPKPTHTPKPSHEPQPNHTPKPTKAHSN